MHARPTLFTLALAVLTMTVGAGLAEEKSGIAPPGSALIQPQLPFALPEMPDGSAASTVPGLAGGSHALPGTGPGFAGGVASVPGGHASAAFVEEDIRDIHGPLHVAASRFRVWTLLIALVVLGGLIAAWLHFRRQALARPRLAYEIALEQLERARALMQPEQAREFSIHVSDAVRTYLDQRFEVGATHCTTQEFLADLVTRRQSSLQPYTEPLRDFLGHCDLAKFAGFVLSVPQMQAMHTSAWRLVDETRPRPEENRNKKASAQDRPSAAADGVPALAAGGAS